MGAEQTNLFVDVRSVVTVGWQIPMDDEFVSIADENLVLVRRMLNDGLNGTWTDDSSTAVLHNSK